MQARVHALAAAMLVATTGLATAQDAASATMMANRMVRAASAWDTNGDGVYTCDEWKAFVTKLFASADKNKDGFIDEKEFATIRDSDQFRDADIGYFDDNRDGKLSRAEFVDKPSQFFLRFDRKRSCKVTVDDIVETLAPPRQQQKSDSPAPGRLR